MPALSQLNVYPVKACRGVPVHSAQITRTGLRGDREFMVVRADNGHHVSQRECPKLALVTPQLPAAAVAGDWDKVQQGDVVTVAAPGVSKPLHLPLLQQPSESVRTITVWEWTGGAIDVGEEAAQWFTSYLGLPVRVVRYVGSEGAAAGVAQPPEGQGLARPTDPEFANGYETSFSDGFSMLLANEASLEDLSKRVAASEDANGAALAPLPMARFRPNLVVSGLPAWDEDKYRFVTVSMPNGGAVKLESVKPCSRCKVTTIDPATGIASEGEPLDTLATFRKGTHMSYQTKSWKHAVHFGWNLVSEPKAVGSRISVGDAVEFAEPQQSW